MKLHSISCQIVLAFAVLFVSPGIQSPVFSQCTYQVSGVSGVTSLTCGQSTNLSASGNGNSFRWYDDPVAGNLLGSSANYSTNALLANDTFYVENYEYTPGSNYYGYSGSSYSWTVPAGVTSIQVTMTGAQGGSYNSSSGGFGAYVNTTLAVTPGNVLYFYVGGQPSNYLGGYNGGGNVTGSSTYTRGGGGASDIRLNGTSLTDRVVVAGGGGGVLGRSGSSSSSFNGGHAGQNGNDGLYYSSGSANRGYGATQNGAGAGGNGSGGAGGFGQGGTGYYASSSYSGGGGGGGWYGGGGGGYSNSSAIGSGGGGSSYAHPSYTTGTSYSTGYQSGHGYISISWSATSCLSARYPVPVDVNQAVAQPVLVNPVSITCGDAAVMQVTGSTGFYQWYDDAVGGNNIGSGDTYVSSALTTNDTFYVEATSVQNYPYCSSVRLMVPVTVNQVVAAPVLVNQLSITCGNTATAEVAGSTGYYNWYSDSVGGNFLGSGNTYTTPILTANDTIYVEATSVLNYPYCSSSRLMVPINVNTVVAQPVLVAPVTINCGLQATIQITGTTGYYNWYSDSVGGNFLYSGDTYLSDILTANDTFYVEATSVLNSPYCSSARLQIPVSVIALAPPLVFSDSVLCGNAGVLMATQSSHLYHWYTQPAGGSPFTNDSIITVNDLTTTTYYVEATSNVNPTGSAYFGYTGGVQSWTVPPGVTSIQVDVAGAQGGTYNSSIGGYGALVTSTLAVTPGETLYMYVGGTTGNASGGWNGGGEAYPNHAYAKGGGGATDIRKNGNSLNNRIITAGGGGGVLGRTTTTSSSYNGGHAGQNGNDGGYYGSSSTTRGYGASQNSGGNGAGGYGGFGFGGNYSSGTGSYSGGGGGGGWYGGGGGIYTGSSSMGSGGGGSSYADPAYATNVNYYTGYQSGNGYISFTYNVPVCYSTRVPVNVVVDTYVPQPVAVGTSTICGTPAVLNASGPYGNFLWYSQPSGGNPIGSGASFTTSGITTNQTFYVEATSIPNPPYCTSPRVAVIVTPTPVPLPAVSADTIVCGNTATLQVSGSTHLYNWFTQPVGGNLVSNDSNFQVTVYNTTTYYVEATTSLSSVGNVPFGYVGGEQTWVVPTGVTSVSIDMAGAQGASYSNGNGGYGGRVQTTLAVTPGEMLYVYVGQQPSSTTPGWNGGGSGAGGGGGGGGGTDIRKGGNSIHDRIVVAGGGGGGGWNCGSTQERGGGGGGSGTAENGYYCNGYNSSYSGRGASMSAGGGNNGYCNCNGGSFFQGGNGYTTNSGGGGGGWYGGGGAGYYSGGGGGSSYAHPSYTSNTSHSQGYRTGHGYVNISYNIPVCSSTRIPVTVMVNQIASPVVQHDTVTCGNTSILAVSGSSGQYEWFSAPAGGNAFAQGNTIGFPPSYTTTSYYVEAYTPNCRSARVPATITVNPLTAPVVSGSTSGCDVVNAILSVSGGSGTYEWYDMPGGNLLATGSTYNTGSVVTNEDYFVRYATGGCFSAYDTATILVDQTPDATIQTTGTFCTGIQPFSLVANSSGGIWTGSGVTSATLGTFDPALANLGANQIIYTHVNGNCSDADTVTLMVNQGPIASILAPGNFCSTGTSATLGAQTPGGTWSGTGITNGTLGTFDPAVAGVGTSQVVYTLTQNNCTDADTVQIQVFATPNASFNQPVPLCSNAPAVTLIPQTMGGVWSGTGITNSTLGTFDPAAANTGLNSVQYLVTANGCADSATVSVQVLAAPDATILNAPPALCSAGNPLTLTAQTPGGVWTGSGITNPGAGVFTPASGNLGGNVVYYSITQNGCSDADTVQIILNASPDATFGSPGALCANGNVITLNPITPGGTWSGTGVTNSTLGTFDPAAALVGNNNVTYSVTQGNCSTTYTLPVTVNFAPNASVLNNPGQLCDNAAALNLVAQSQGGFWTGPGIINNSTGLFDPQFANPGINTLYYSVTQNNCTDADTIQIQVNTSPVISMNLSGLQQVCEGTTVNLVASGGTSYQWMFNTYPLPGETTPSLTATQQGSYSVSVGDAGCFSISQPIQLNVNPKPQAQLIQANDVCEGLAVVFNQLSVVANVNGASVTGYDWAFGDGNTGNGFQVSHVYGNAGSYTPQLIITTNHGCSDTVSGQVHVNPNPVINTVSVPAVCHPLLSNHSASASISGVNGSSIASYHWALGDGFVSNAPVLTHGYPSNGSYFYTLTVTSNLGCSVASTGYADVHATPVAGFLSGNVCTGSITQFTDASTIPGGTISGWNWNFGDNSGQSQAQNPAYFYNQPGTYPVTLTVTSTDGCSDSYMQNVQVAPAPDASWTVLLNGPLTANFSPVVADPNAVYTWNFSDGTTFNQMNIFKVFQQPGVYQVCLSVAKNGCTTESCSDVTVSTATGTNDPVQELNWSVYPNPVADFYNVEVNLLGTADIQITLYDMTGRVLQTDLYKEAGAGKYVYAYDAQKMSMRAGAYLVEVRVNGKPYTTRILKRE